MYRLLAIVALLALLTITPTTADDIKAVEPDLVIVGWTVIDTPDGNNDGGLHPGESAYLEIHLQNRGGATARNVAGVLDEASDHPDIEILDKYALWPDLPATGTPAAVLAPRFKIRADRNRPCNWEIGLRLGLTAADGYMVEREFTLVMTDPHMIDIAGSAARPFIFGTDPGDTYSTDIASADFDGDGYDDILIGAIWGDGEGNGTVSAGEVTIVYGSWDMILDFDLALPLTQVTTVYGELADKRLGRRIRTGDFDGDGYEDAALALHTVDGADGTTSFAGQVVLLYGHDDRHASLPLGSPPTTGLTGNIYGEALGHNLGLGLATGDLNGDGYDDLIASAPYAEGNGRVNSGQIMIFYGGPSRIDTIDLATTPESAITIFGVTENAVLGLGLATGDVDGDGYDDIIAAAPESLGPGGRPECGYVALIYGGPERLVGFDLASPPSNVAFIWGADAFDYLGDVVLSGDLNGDGYDDLILGSAYADGPANDQGDTGETAIIYGRETRLSDIDLASSASDAVVIYGIDSGDYSAIKAIGDFDGDGFDDLVFTAQQADSLNNLRLQAGEAAIIPGRADRLSDIDMATPPPDVTFIYGAEADDYLGGSAAAGDINGDGLDDLLIGCSGGDGPVGGRASAGEAVVVPGEPRMSYRHDADVYSFIDATSGIEAGLTCDDCSVTIPIGFDFNFYGRVYDSVEVSSNGYLTFGDLGDMPQGFCPPASNPPDGVIAPFWDDFNLEEGGAVYYLLEGSEPHRRLTVEWFGVPLYPNIDGATFEVSLFEGSDQILFQYLDTYFGVSGSDWGESAVIGVESPSGLHGSAFSCNTPYATQGASRLWRRFASPTVIWKDDFENDTGGWTADGLWHRVSEPTCTPSARSGDWSWYYGQDGTCDYDTGAATTGTLTSEIVNALPQDAELSFWYRRGVEGPTVLYDQCIVQVQGDGGGFDTVEQLTDVADLWLNSSDLLEPAPISNQFAAIDLSSYSGQDVELQFLFDSVDLSANNYTGWMVDDVTLRACPVYDSGEGAAAAEARATALPDLYCEGGNGRVDALGSYCTACDALTYQWYENGQPLANADGVAYQLPPTMAPADYEYTVEIDCATAAGCVALSDVEEVRIVALPLVGPTLLVGKASGGIDMEFHWSDVGDAESYELFSDSSPAGAFVVDEGSTASGVTGMVVPIREGDMHCYLVAARNSLCGLGPK